MAIIIAFTVLALFYFLGYRGYSRIITDKVFGLSDKELTPANNPALRDDYDYVPTAEIQSSTLLTALVKPRQS